MDNEQPADAGTDDPVTVLVTRRPIAGREAEFEDYIKGITQAASRQPGHLGSTIFSPSGGKDPAYRILFRFDRRSNLERWEQSAERDKWREVARQVSQPREAQVETGLEAWFNVPNCDVPAHPPRARMAAVVWLGVFLIVSVLNVVLSPFIDSWPMLLRTLVFTGVVVVLLTWVVMPRLTRWLSAWLHPHQD